MAKVGRPPKIAEVDIPALVEKFRKYIEETPVPIIAKFAAENWLGKQYLYDHSEFSELLKVAIAKKEGNLEDGTLKGTLNPAMAIFSLKQLGWTDKTQQEVLNTNIDATGMTPQERRKRIEELIGEAGAE